MRLARASGVKKISVMNLGGIGGEMDPKAAIRLEQFGSLLENGDLR